MRSIVSKGGMVIGVAVAAGLIGCGGDGTKPASTRDGAGAPAAVTADSAADIVRTASDQMMSAHMVADLGVERGRAVLGAQLASVEADPAVGGLAMELLSQLMANPELFGAAQATLPRAVVQLPVTNCASGGTVATSLNDIDNTNSVTNGDGVTFTLNQCAARMATASGTLSIANIQIVGLPVANSTAPWSVLGDFTFTQLNLVDQMMGATLVNGTLSASWQNSSATQASGTLTVDNLTLTRNRAVTTLSNVTMNTTTDRSTTPPTVSMTMSGSVTDPTLGALNVQTIQPMVRPAGPGHPSAGAMAVTMSNGVKVTATTMSGTTVQLQAFNSGSATASLTSTTSWEAIHDMTGGGMPR